MYIVRVDGKPCVRCPTRESAQEYVALHSLRMQQRMTITAETRGKRRGKGR